MRKFIFLLLLICSSGCSVNYYVKDEHTIQQLYNIRAAVSEDYVNAQNGSITQDEINATLSMIDALIIKEESKREMDE